MPSFFFDHDLPTVYGSLLDGRADAIGPDDADLPRADAVIAGARRPWNAAAFAAAGPRLRVVSRVGIGYDNVDLGAASAAGVVVCNTPDGPTVSTAEHTWALLLAVARELPSRAAAGRDGLAGSPIGTALELDGRVLGLVGYGRIARRVAAAGRAFGMHVLAADPFVTASGDGTDIVSLDEVLRESDVVSLHAPATPETRHLICAQTISGMKPGALLINSARGTLVDQEALLDALDSGHLGGAGLDVTDPEPLPVGHPLLAHAKVIVTPHIASSTVAGRRRLYAMAIDNALAVLDGRPATTVTS